MSEEVLVCPKEILPYFSGIREFDWELWKRILSNVKFIKRDEAERSEKYKQLIPYCVVSKGKDLLSYRRTSNSGEKRLRSLYSIGIGGHINPIDFDETRLGVDAIEIVERAIYNCVKREIKEELGFDVDNDRLNLIGFLNDDSNLVGSVHLGVVFVLYLGVESKVHFRLDSTIDSLRFVTIEELLNQNETTKYETWSKILIAFLGKNEGVIE